MQSKIIIHTTKHNHKYIELMVMIIIIDKIYKNYNDFKNLIL